MGNLSIKNYHTYVEIGLLIIGVLILFLSHNPLRYAGLVFIASALGVFFFSSFYKADNDNSNGNYRSRTRDQILKHQKKIK